MVQGGGCLNNKLVTVIFMMLYFYISLDYAFGAIYAYRDEKGRLYLTDNPPNKKYKIVVTSSKDRAEPTLPDNNYKSESFLRITPQKILLPNDETFSKYINEAAKYFNVDPYLIKAVIKVESDFDPYAVSHKGAQGLMQLIPSTAKLVGCNKVFDPYDNIMGGTKYLRLLLDRFDWNLDLALAAYNAGPKRVEQYNGIPPIRETINYVKKVKHYYNYYKKGINSNGFNNNIANNTIANRRIVSQSLIVTQKLINAYKKYQNQDIDGAIMEYQEILNISPKNTQALYNLACLLDYERRYDEAIDTYKAAIKEDPYLDKAYYNLAIIYEKLGYHKEAIATWRQYMLATNDEEKIQMAEKFVRELEDYIALKK